MTETCKCNFSPAGWRSVGGQQRQAPSCPQLPPHYEVPHLPRTAWPKDPKHYLGWGELWGGWATGGTQDVMTVLREHSSSHISLGTIEYQWGGFQVYLEITNFWGQCRVLFQKPSIGVLDLGSPQKYEGISSTPLTLHPVLFCLSVNCKFSPHMILSIDDIQNAPAVMFLLKSRWSNSCTVGIAA